MIFSAEVCAKPGSSENGLARESGSEDMDLGPYSVQSLNHGL